MTFAGVTAMTSVMVIVYKLPYRLRTCVLIA
jgi:hypothetical protein